MILNDLMLKARGDFGVEVHTDFGKAVDADVIGGKLYVFNPQKITVDEFLDFLDDTRITGLEGEKLEWVLETINEKAKE